jgi:hypothetical protein
MAMETEADGDREYQEVSRLREVIHFMPPTSVADAAIKLRLVTDQDTGMGCGNRTDGGDVVAVQQVLAFLEALYQGTHYSAGDSTR